MVKSPAAGPSPSAFEPPQTPSFTALFQFVFIVITGEVSDFRCVNDGDKALALGILATAVALFGFLPNPIIYGAVIDSSCLVWEQSCGKRGSCWVYATDQFRYRLHGVTSGFLLIAGVFEVITYFQIKDLKLFDSRK